jgi:predicted PurR-regulated permease PerM
MNTDTALDVLSRKVAPSDSALERFPSTPRGADIGLGILVLVVVALAARALLPFWLPLVLSAWFAQLAQPLNRALERRLHGKARAAALVTVLLVLAVLTPVAVVVLMLAGDASALIGKVFESQSAGSALDVLLSRGGNGATELAPLTKEPERLIEWIQKSGAGAFRFAGMLAGATFTATIALIVFVAAFHGLLVDGRRLGGWLEQNAPVSTQQFRRLSAAFYETGRGLVIGVGGTALAQGLVAGIGYWIAGIPHAFALALLTALVGLIPSLGSALVWLPMGGILLISGRIADAVVVLAFGSFAGVIDNFLRPVLSRYGHLEVPTTILFCAMLGGVVAFGAAGLIVGPLFVRLSMEGLELWARRHEPELIAGGGSEEGA